MQISNATKITLLLLSMLTVMSNVAIITSLPHLRDHFLDVESIDFLSRLMITLPSLSIAILSPFLGHLLNHFSKKSALIFALLFFSVTGSAGLYVVGIDALLMSRFMFGIAVAMLMILTTALVGDYFSQDERHKYMGMQSAFTSLGGLLFLVGGGLLSDIDWRYPFGVYLVGVLYIPFVKLFIKEPNSHAKMQTSDGPASLGKIYFLAFLLMLVFYILPTQMPFLMIQHFGASGTLTGSIIATAFVFNALGAMSFSRLKKRFEFKHIYFIGMSIVGVGFLLIGLVQDVHYFFLTSPILGFGGGILMTNIVAWMLSQSEAKTRVKSSGYLTSALFFGQFASPVVFYPIVAVVGVQNFFEVVGGLIVLVLVGLKVSKRV